MKTTVYLGGVVCPLCGKHEVTLEMKVNPPKVPTEQYCVDVGYPCPTFPGVNASTDSTGSLLALSVMALADQNRMLGQRVTDLEKQMKQVRMEL